MYHFVKLENNTWYLQPHKEQDVIDHFNKVEYCQNAEGKWEARVDGVQIRSKCGCASWSIKAYAKEVARKFCNGSNNKY